MEPDTTAKIQQPSQPPPYEASQQQGLGIININYRFDDIRVIY
jgi:hypothetical protein